MARVVQELPRQLRQLRGIGQPQPQPHSRLLRAGQAEAALQGVPQLVLEYRAIQLAAEVFQRRAFRSARPASAAAALADLQHEVFQLHLRERQRELHRGAFPGWRAQHPGPVAALRAGFDQQVEILVGELAFHGGPLTPRRRRGAARSSTP